MIAVSHGKPGWTLEEYSRQLDALTVETYYKKYGDTEDDAFDIDDDEEFCEDDDNSLEAQVYRLMDEISDKNLATLLAEFGEDDDEDEDEDEDEDQDENNAVDDDKNGKSKRRRTR